MHGQEWTEAEIECIRLGLNAGLSYPAIAIQMPGRSAASIRGKANRLGIRIRHTKNLSEETLKSLIRLSERDRDLVETNINAAQDKAFQDAMRKAVGDGLEFVEEGVSTVPCTDNPVVVRPYAIQFSRSPSLMCAENGDAKMGGAW